MADRRRQAVERETAKPVLALSGADGNAFAILRRCRRAARRAGWSEEKIGRFEAEAIAGDYDNLLRVVTDRFEVL